MRKQIVLAILLLSVIFFSFNEKKELPDYLFKTGKPSVICGPSFDYLYNQSSTMNVDYVTYHDPYSNFIQHDVFLEPGDNLDISDSGSLCGYAGGHYHYFITLNSPTTGSIKIIDLNNSNAVVACKNTSSSSTFYQLGVDATCGARYAIILSDASC